ncbi:MFS transporter [Periweissella beninensis]|uniref:MFS transporter n=1 Tax=Periweissella beninensis TaxID=504936 RepID=A0ABT0VIX2_9LACO|nr:MFS transporter [Periweissella beninensis]MBM7544275.1 MFS family permease [Periweissella beninensis]MCM2437777.1 MFS transporter [Periweissella beninensis]MCT4396431.1 MFS transporter [Periweissella beninensis]
MNSRDSFITKIAFLSVSFVLTSAYAIQGALPQMKAALNISQTQAEYLATSPAFLVIFFVIASPFIARLCHLSDKKVIQIGLIIVGLAGIAPFFISNYWLILLSRLILGAGFGLYNSQAIALISVWYAGNDRSQMLGWRAAAEQLGQACTLVIAGGLLTFSWHAPFLVYLLAFVALAIFSFRVPDDEHLEEQAQTTNVTSQDVEPTTHRSVTKISPMVGLLVAFAFILVVDYVGMNNRFSGLAVAINGQNYQGASLFLSLMLVGATLGGITYGTIQKHLGFNTVYLGLGLMAIANFLFGLAGNNFVVMVVGLLLIGFPLQLVSPLIFNLLPDLAPLNKQPLVTSLVLIGFNFGAFFSPTAAEIINKLLNKPMSGLGLAAPFPIYGVILLVIAGIIFITKQKNNN